MSKEIIDHEMCVHIFGGVSSGACSNYALRRTAIENENKYGKDATETLKNNFYIDKMLKSVENEDKAIRLIKDVKSMCQEGGFNLTKFASNSKRVLRSIPEKDRKIGVKNNDLLESLPEERALGVLWNVENDTLGFKVSLKEKPLTRRGVLSVLSSIYDPLGFGAPFLLKGKQIIQKLCQLNLKWDEDIPDDISNKWLKWKENLPNLEMVHLGRCFKPHGFGKVVDCSLHHFSDACENGYGQVSYIRLVDDGGRIYCSLVMGKACVAPLKYISIPRMELVAATLTVKQSALLRKELQYPDMKETFWTDSEAVLGYIVNESRKFKIFVANRVEMIKEGSDPSQWFHVNSKENPADYNSRGVEANNVNAVKMWFEGPSFLWRSTSTSNIDKLKGRLSPEDPEVKKEAHVYVTSLKDDILSRLEKRISNWNKMKRIVGMVLQYKYKLLSKVRSTDHSTDNNNHYFQADEEEIIRMVQKGDFKGKLMP